MFLRIRTWAALAILGACAATPAFAEETFALPFGLSTLDVNEQGQMAVDGHVTSPEAEFGIDSWNECSGPVSGNYVGLPCIKTRGMSNEFAAYLRAHMIACSAAGLANVGGGSVSAVHILHDGTLADSRHEKTSLHAAGRAIDILALSLTTSRGTKKFSFRDTSSNPNGSDRKFFEGFRSCWDALQKARSCPARESGNPRGTIGWEDDHHRNHHLHTSMPFCPNKGGWFDTAVGDELENN